MVEPQTPGFPDHAKPTVETEGVSPKAAVSGVVGLVVGVVVAILNAVQETQLLGALPGWLQVVVLAVLPPVLAYLGAYQAPPGTVVTKRS